MSVRKAQNRVRKQYGIGKGALHKRIRATRDALYKSCLAAEWGKATWAGEFTEGTRQRMHELVDELATDAVIATAYREAETAAIMEDARASG